LHKGFVTFAAAVALANTKILSFRRVLKVRGRNLLLLWVGDVAARANSGFLTGLSARFEMTSLFSNSVRNDISIFQTRFGTTPLIFQTRFGMTSIFQPDSE
jgi:hypothetical protein